jgi:hypothetical protein
LLNVKEKFIKVIPNINRFTLKVALMFDGCYYGKVTLFKKPLRRKEQPKYVFCEHVIKV